MVYRGYVENGVIRLEGAITLPEGLEVRVEVAGSGDTPTEPGERTLFDRLKPIIGVAQGLPADLAEHHDHYLHGQAKQ